MLQNRKERKWPENCVWPEPIWDGEGQFWDTDLAEMAELDENGQDLLDIKDYMDDLVKSGRLNPDYSLNDDYEDEDKDDAEDEGEYEPFSPEKGIDYWDEGFDLEAWEEDLSTHMNMLKIEICTPDPVSFIWQVTGYTFINENLVRQAFTRRAFALEYGVGDSELLEFYGDAVLNTVVSRELYKRFSDTNICVVEAPFQSRHSEGDLSIIRQKFVSKDWLAQRAVHLGLDRFILYGSGEEHSDSACEDMMEALIGAVAADSDWDWSLLADIVDRLINLQLDSTGDLVKKSCYDQFNSWHQKHFGCMPEYTVDRSFRERGNEFYDCALRFSVPENDKGIRTAQRIDVQGAPTRSSVREYAAKEAIAFLQNHGLWMNLADAGIEPNIENSINQLQELFQKKYVEEPVYSFEEQAIIGAEWYCSCACSGIESWGKASSKTKAKKKAAFMALVRLMQSAGICKDEWEKEMWSLFRK